MYVNLCIFLNTNYVDIPGRKKYTQYLGLELTLNSLTISSKYHLTVMQMKNKAKSGDDILKKLNPLLFPWPSGETVLLEVSYNALAFIQLK